MSGLALRAGGTTPFRVVFDGQSLNVIPPYEGNILGWSYPWYLMRGRGIPASVVAVSGQSWTTLFTTIESRLYPVLNRADVTVLIMCGGTSDIASGDSGAQLYADHRQYADAARTEGATYVIATTLVGNTGNDAGEEAARAAFNALLLADAGNSFDAVVDLDATALTDWTDGDYYFDGVHWYDPGAVLAANTVAPALDLILDTLPTPVVPV
jgi:hypothetical protein